MRQRKEGREAAAGEVRGHMVEEEDGLQCWYAEAEK